MADELTLGHQQLTVLHYQVQQSQWHFPATTCSKLGQPTLDSALKQGKERVCYCEAVNFIRYSLAGMNGMSISNFWCATFT